MPMLWSWLWGVSEGDAWYRWLSSMQYGRLSDVRATLSLPWAKPLPSSPTAQDLAQLSYHVLTHVEGADINLGSNDKFLLATDAYLEIDQNHLTADIRSADLGKNLGRLHGDYTISWHDLLMRVQAKGVVDVGGLHAWFDDEVASSLAWDRAAAYANVEMLWNANESSPQQMLLTLKPKGVWHMQPKGVALSLHDGVAILDLQRGLKVQDMRFISPWFEGDMAMFMANKQGEWSLKDLQVDASTSLVQLTEQFSLPITQPQGETQLKIDYQQGHWKGSLDFTQNDWLSFFGYDKQGKEALAISFSGVSAEQSLLPIHIEQWRTGHDDFQLQGSMDFTEENVDILFQAIETPYYYGDLRLLLPWDEAFAWGVEVNAGYVNKNIVAAYFKDEKTSEETNGKDRQQAAKQAWTLYADIEWLAWDESFAEQVKVEYRVDQESSLNLSAANLHSGDADLQQVKASLAILTDGKVELKLFEAEGSGQHLMISGAVEPLNSGLLKWQGMVLMGGEFGTLMHQAELDKLFQQGEMAALFLGHGEFEVGQPWWRGMEGRFRLRVDDGRIMQGGTLVRLLAAISLVDWPKYFIFQRDDVVGEGLLYDRLQLEADFVNEKLHINQLAFQSSALDAGGRGEVDLASGDMDILLIARPWQNIEAILGSIPLLGDILTGKDKSLLRKIYRIHGPASDAQVDELEPQDIGLPSSGLLETLFSLPGQWFGERKGEQ